MPDPVPLIEPRGLWVGLLFLALLVVFLWADRKWPATCGTCDHAQRPVVGVARR